MPAVKPQATILPNRGARLLRAYLDKHKWTSTMAARALGIGSAYVSLLICEGATPGLKVALIIESKFFIAPREWFTSPDGVFFL